MKMFRLNRVVAAALACFSAATQAEDELLVYAIEDGALLRGLELQLDGGERQTPGPGGVFQLNLRGGGHSLQLFRDGQPLHAFRFDSADDQQLDVRVELSAGREPQVAIDAYFPGESSVQSAAAATGALSGMVMLDGQPLVAATVTVADVGAAATTDTDGRFSMELPRGAYQVTFSHEQLGQPVQREMRVVAGLALPTTVALSGAAEMPAVEDAVQLEEVVVTAAPVSAFAAAERYAESVVDSMDAAQLARYGDSDIAASVVRLPSITIEDGRYVFVRGLGDRYITATLNGSTLPSTNPSRRTVPLDLFPSNIVQRVDVNKTFLASMPAESTGGNVEIDTRSFPAAAAGKLSLLVGVTPGLTGETVNTDPTSGDFDYLGWDDGTREENGLLPLISTALEHSDEYSQNTLYELQRVGGLLIKDGLDPDTTDATPKVSLGMNYGDLLTLESGNEVGFFVAANYKNGWEQRDEGISRTYLAGNDLEDDFHFVEHSNIIEASGLLSLGLNVGDSSYQANTLFSRYTDSSVRVSEGLDGDSDFESYQYSIDWTERQFLSQQVSGEHAIAGGSLTAGWQLTGSQARQLIPDRREVRFDLRESDGIYNLEVPELTRRYDDLVDDNLDASSDWKYSFAAGRLGSSTLKFGAKAILRERDSNSATYGYGDSNSVEDNAPNRLVSDVLTQDSITGDTSTGYAFQDKTQASDSYDADLKLFAGYLSNSLVFSDYEVIVGLRYEQWEQNVNTFEIQSGAAEQATGGDYDETDWLPTLSFNWFVSEQQQVRAAVSKTSIRPDFKEAVNATFYDKECDCRIVGNPELVPGESINADLRWERYFNRTDNVSVAVFYKDMKNTIERVVLTASGTAGNSRTYVNAPAELYGLELDGRKEFDLTDDYSRSLFVAFNGSLIESEAKLLNEAPRKLQGQPTYTANLILGLDDIPTGQEVTLLLNQSGETIRDVGVNRLPNVIEQPRLSLNLNYRLDFTDSLQLRVKLNNLLDADYEQTQGGELYRRYKRGMEVEAGIDWTF